VTSFETQGTRLLLCARSFGDIVNRQDPQFTVVVNIYCLLANIVLQVASRNDAVLDCNSAADLMSVNLFSSLGWNFTPVIIKV
jgi:hypothetical protein